MTDTTTLDDAAPVEDTTPLTARTTVAKVRAILPKGSTLTDDQIQAAIDAASCVIDQMAASHCGSGLKESCLIIAETYLAAHIAACTENTLSLQSETGECCGGDYTYGFKFGEGVLGTPFGQTANMLTSGCLLQQDMRPATFFSIGTIGNC